VTFLWQAAAWGLISLPIILLLHVLRNRRQQLPISSLQLWRGLQQKKQGSLPRSIPLSVMLMLQLLVATGLTLALAQPVFSFLLKQPSHHIFILDLTTSMTAEDVGLGSGAIASRFDLAKQSLQADLQSLAEQDAFTLIGLKAKPEVLFSGTGAQKEQTLLALANLAPGATGIDLLAALDLAKGFIDPNRQNQILILTDAAYSVDPAALPMMPAPVEWQIISGQAPAGNQAWLNVSARAWPDGRQRLFGRVVNYSDQPVAKTIEVYADERRFDTLTIQLEPQGETARVWTLPAQTLTAALQLVEADSLALDNRADLLLTETNQAKVLLISETPDTLSRALTAQPGVELSVASPTANTPDPANFDLVVYEGSALPLDWSSWPGGNIWVVNPPLGHPLLTAQNFSRNLRPNLATASALLSGIDLSGVYFNRVLQLTVPPWAEVDLLAAPVNTSSGEISLAPPQPLLFHGTPEDSRIVVWTFDLAASNLPARLALPLLTAATLQMVLSPALQAVVPVGQAVALNGNFQIELPDGVRLSPSPAQQSWAGEFSQTKQPGIYKVFNQQNQSVAGFAVHAGSALESNLHQQFQPETLAIAQAPVNILPPQVDYLELWPWLAGLVLTVMMLEGWLAWRR
jgi:hypothetical protein